MPWPRALWCDGPAHARILLRMRSSGLCAVPALAIALASLAGAASHACAWPVRCSDPRLQVGSELIDFGYAVAGEPGTDHLVVWIVGSELCEARYELLLPADSEFEVVDGPGPYVQGLFTSIWHAIRYNRSSSGTAQDTLLVRRLDAPYPDRLILLKGAAGARPQLELDPAGPHFVTVPHDGTVEIALGLRNVGAFPLLLAGDALLLPDPGTTPHPAPGLMPPIEILDAAGFRWDLDSNGAVMRGTRDVFFGGSTLREFLHSGAVSEEEGRIEFVFGPEPIEGLDWTRKVLVSPSGAYLRSYEEVFNPGEVAQTRRVDLLTSLGPTAARFPLATSGGDARLSEDDRWVVTARGPGGEPSVILVFAGPDAALSPSVLAGLDMNIRFPGSTLYPWIRFAFDVVVPPGESRAVLSFLGQRDDSSQAVELAEELAAPVAAALLGLSPQERERVVNFGLPRSLSLSLPATPIPADGETPVSFTLDGRVLPPGVYEGRLLFHQNNDVIPDVVVPLHITVTGPPVSVEPGHASVSIGLSGLRPNPARTGSLAVECVLEAGRPARLEVVDLRGRLCHAQSFIPVQPGPQVVRLSPMNGLAAGVYWIRLRQANEVAVRKGIVLP